MIYDYLIIGAGISGAAAAYELAHWGSVAVIEAESTAGFHTTGRSAALFTPNYGADLVRKISHLSYSFLDSPPSRFTEQPILSPRGMLSVVPYGCEEQLAEVLQASGSDVECVSTEEALAMVPFLRSENVCSAIYEKGVVDIDVDALHQGFLRGLQKRGGIITYDKRVSSIIKRTTDWEVVAGDQTFRARVIVNAAGAWAGEVGTLAGAMSIGLVPKRRTAVLVDAPTGVDVNTLPAIDFVGIESYIKPSSGRLMVSPGDASPMPPQDIQPDDFEVAVLVDWLERETRIDVKRVNHSWAGLRSFVPDNTPVVGFDPLVEGFFWLAGQGGYGIMMSSSLGRAACELICRGNLPGDFLDLGIDEKSLSARRL